MKGNKKLQGYNNKKRATHGKKLKLRNNALLIKTVKAREKKVISMLGERVNIDA